jgi:hypothetical protein
LELFLKHSELKGLSPQTIKFHEQKINRFLHFAKSRKISPELIEDFKEYLLQTNSPATINIYISTPYAPSATEEKAKVF